MGDKPRDRIILESQRAREKAEMGKRQVRQEPGKKKLEYSIAAEFDDMGIHGGEWTGGMGWVAGTALVDLGLTRTGKGAPGIVGSGAVGYYRVWGGEPDHLDQEAIEW